MNKPLSCDLAIIGGGLAGGLIALAFAERCPDVSLLLVERDAVFGGNHLWSFFDGDVPDADRWLVDPLVGHRWAEGHDVRFPTHRRTLVTPYNSVPSARLDARLRAVLGDRAITGAEAAAISPTHVQLADGRAINARAVIDARGGGDLSALRCGWQKFVGSALRLEHPHGLTRPVIMDATVDQIDGYRFVYLLPFDERTVFIEDTYYSDSPALDEAAIDARIAGYAAAQDWRIEAHVHRETGVLPVVYGGDFDRFWPKDDPVARAGVRGGLFHPMTGYSLPDAVAFALWMTQQPLDNLPAATRGRAAVHWRKGRYYRLLGKMLFGAAEPDQRYRIFQRFYRLHAPLIDRFYGGQSTAIDRLSILCGRPPVPIRGAMRAIMNHSA
ncbi:lycopene beta-cyclase CrtY [Sphingobium aromaticiconvertens]|uniref:lycopene beta-cyclase CrtY n=1 Tax=Sphingobium aromaticiconvertens TaxID=365341 RepID=UPI003017C430